jgi:hypothetical protein
MADEFDEKASVELPCDEYPECLGDQHFIECKARLRPKVARLLRERRACQHLIVCNYRYGAVGGPGCICLLVNKNDVNRDLVDAHAKGISTFQDQIRERLIRDYNLFDGSIDGAGSDGDAIDFTMAEIAQAVQQIEERAKAQGFREGVDYNLAGKLRAVVDDGIRDLLTHMEKDHK